MNEKINAIQLYLNICRSLANVNNILHHVGIYIENDYGCGKDTETLPYHIRAIYKDLDSYTLNILGISPYDDVAETFTNMVTQYAYGDDSITTEGILTAIEKNT